MSVSFAKPAAHSIGFDETDATEPALADQVLLVEDSEDDVIQFQRLLRRGSPQSALDVVMDGETAVTWLTERLAEHATGRVSLPRALFLDLRLPGMRGTELLQWVRNQPGLDRALVVVWSSSLDLRDIADADRLGADLYINKFPNVEQFAALMRVSDPRTLRPVTFGDHRGAIRQR